MQASNWSLPVGHKNPDLQCWGGGAEQTRGVKYNAGQMASFAQNGISLTFGGMHEPSGLKEAEITLSALPSNTERKNLARPAGSSAQSVGSEIRSKLGRDVLVARSTQQNRDSWRVALQHIVPHAGSQFHQKRGSPHYYHRTDVAHLDLGEIWMQITPGGGVARSFGSFLQIQNLERTHLFRQINKAS